MRTALMSSVMAVAAAVFAVAAGGITDSTAAPAASSSPSPPASSTTAVLQAAATGQVVPPRLEQVELMCALLLGCHDVPMFLPTRDFGQCVRHYWAQLASPEAVLSSLNVRECGLHATSCDQLARCALRGASPAACEGRGIGATTPVGRCDLEGRALSCLDGKVVSVRDCPRGGTLCAVREGVADCVAGPCNVDAGASATPVCSGDGKSIMQCAQGRWTSVNCAALGLRCVLDSRSEPSCAPHRAASCSAKAARCDGSTAVTCLRGREYRVACDQAGLACGVGASAIRAVGSCAKAAKRPPECHPSQSASFCDGDNVVYCVAGERRTYSCKSFFGLTRCVGKPGQAHCT